MSSCCVLSNCLPAVACAESCCRSFPVRDYDLAATLSSGQAFRWYPQDHAWIGVVGRRWVRLRSASDAITAETAAPTPDWVWLVDYLQLEVDLDAVIATFPEDKPMQTAAAACRGLRLLRQDPWECLASFILSSTKQIVQIQQIISLLCARYGEPLPSAVPGQAAYAFPTAERLAALAEADLRACKMGFRAPFLLKAARRVAEGRLALHRLFDLPLEQARAELLQIEGVGAKISDCVLLFAFGRQGAFPVDVWVMKALRRLYFRGRKVNLRRLQAFAVTHFGPNAGFAQQYLFHYARLRMDHPPEL